MALVHVNGRLYYTKSMRVGGRVTSMSYGPALSEYARAMVLMDRLLREERRAERMQRQEERRERAGVRRSDRIAAGKFRDRIAAADSAVAQYHRQTRRLADGMLRALGYHRHARGQWRRRQVMTTELSKIDPAELARLAAAGDVRTLERLLYRAEVALYQRAEEGTLNRGGIEEGLLQTLGPGFGRAEKEAMLAEARLIARDLAPPGSSPAELLLADRAAVEWLAVPGSWISTAPTCSTAPRPRPIR